MVKRFGRVVIIGDLFLDILPSALPISKELILKDGETFVESVTFQRGGCAGNFAAVLANLMGGKGDVLFCSKVGNDKNGDFLIEQMESYGLKTAIGRSDRGTAITIAISYNDGERHFITYNGAMDDFGIDDIPSDVFKGADHLAWRGIWFTPGLLFNAAEFLKAASDEGTVISMDLGWDPAWNDPSVGDPAKRTRAALSVLKYVDFLFGNIAEIRRLTGENNNEDAVKKVLEAGARNVVVHMGEKGAALYDRGGNITEIPAYRVEKIVNPVGTGDTFDAAFVYRLLAGDSPEAAARFGAKAAAYSLSRPAGTPLTEDALSRF